MGKRVITTKQSKAIRALISGLSASDTAKPVGVHVNTIYKWAKNPEFQEALKNAETDALQTVTLALLSLAGKATETLDTVMESATHASSRVRAADIVLGRLLQTRELIALEERISKLEEMFDEHK